MNKQAEEAVNKELYKNVLEIMEQLEKSCDQIKELPINNAERLQGVVDLVYDKAVDEPNFSKTAGFMTLQLAGINVSANDPENSPKTFNFLEFITKKCQMEFEKNWKDDEPLYKKMRCFVNKCIDPAIKKDFDNIIEKLKQKFKTKALGNIRFIGELFKHSIFPPMSMVLFMFELLKNEDDDRLECLCELLKAVGEKLENTLNISHFFIKMQEIIDKESTNISSYIRELLQDVINLRNSNWLPRKQELNPKKMKQTQNEADTEQLINSGSVTTPQKDDRISGDGGLATDGSQAHAAVCTMESQKLENSPPPFNDMILGSKSLFEQWGSGSVYKFPTADEMFREFAEYNEIDKTGFLDNPEYYEAPSVSHNTQWSSSNKHNHNDGRNSRSGSQHRNTLPNQSPANLAEPKRYNPAYLRSLSNNPMCQKKPENLPNFDIYLTYDNRGGISDRRSKFSKNSQHRKHQ